MSEDLKELRVKIDSIDTQLVELFKQRMAVSRDIAAYKKEHSMPTLDAGRERALLAKVGTPGREELAEYTESVFRSILAAGRSYQNQCSGVKSQVYETIRRAPGHHTRADALSQSVGLSGHRGGLFPDRLRQHFQVPLHPVLQHLRARVQGGGDRHVPVRHPAH